jgi:hypothetical protein
MRNTQCNEQFPKEYVTDTVSTLSKHPVEQLLSNSKFVIASNILIIQLVKTFLASTKSYEFAIVETLLN